MIVSALLQWASGGNRTFRPPFQKAPGPSALELCAYIGARGARSFLLEAAFATDSGWQEPC
jgi:hypothetical protein